MNNLQIPDNILLAALKAYEDGKSPAQIALMFPRYKSDIELLMSVVVKLSEQGAKIKPRPKLMQHILQNLENERVTSPADDRYINREHLKGRSHLPLITNLKYTMSTAWKIVVPVGLVAILALVVFTTLKLGSPGAPTNQGPITQSTSNTPATDDFNQIASELTQGTSADTTSTADTAPASGKVDEVVAEILIAAQAESTLFTEETSDADLVAYDSQELVNLEQAYDSNLL